MPVAAVAVAASVASAVAQKRAAKKAAKAQAKGLETQQALLKRNDPVALNKAAQIADKERAERRLALQKELDPELAELRQLSKQQMLEQAKVAPEDRQSGKLARTLYEEVKAPDERTERIKDQLLAAAQQELSAGATLPPEFQAELVRSGLSTGSQAGFAIDKNVIGGGVARALGSAGIQLQQQRQQQAMAMTQQAENLKNSRVNILSSVFPRLRDLETANINEARQSFGLAEAALPESGLGGTDIVNLKMAQMKNQMALAGQKSNLAAQKAQAQGQFMGQMMGAGASAIGAGIGAMGSLGGASASQGFGGVVNDPTGAVGGVTNIGYYGSRNAQQQANYNALQRYYE